MKRISVIFGTRPEAIKLAPVIIELRKRPEVDCRVCVTAQHREMLDQVLPVFDIVPDHDLNLMRKNQSLAGFTARALTALDKYLSVEKPDLILVQGDTTTVFCASLAAFYHRIPVGHVEAGLRTWNMDAPWPEEANRVLTSRLAALHFAPTEWSRDNLLKEGVPADRIQVTGNTVIDALFIALKKIRANPPHIPGLPDFLQPGARSPEPSANPTRPDGTGSIHDSQFTTVSRRSPEPVEGAKADHNSQSPSPRLVLITGHRRESFGEGFDAICRAIAALASSEPGVHFVYPVHLNPRVRKPVHRDLARIPNVHLIEPLEYLPFVALMQRAHLILTDSGGVQEEAPSLGKPVLVMRSNTERPEGVHAGTVKLVGADEDSIIRGVNCLLKKGKTYTKMSQASNPYGDGRAARRIVRLLQSARRIS